MISTLGGRRGLGVVGSDETDTKTAVLRFIGSLALLPQSGPEPEEFVWTFA
ncbi:MAG: hypothetical protein ORN51_12900 [Akkermansiaceae bacterium]|nr:hypothetical protein [Akkermansiaceae bacterium]